MTGSQPNALESDGLGVAEGAEVSGGTIETLSKRVPAPREHWIFLGRERHYGFDYLIWTLAANPKEPNTLGKRWARVVG